MVNLKIYKKHISQKFTYPYSLYTIILQAQTEADIDFMLEELDRLGHDL